MIERYAVKTISDIWIDSVKVKLWQDIELAVIRAQEELKEFPADTFEKVSKALQGHEVDLDWWKEREKATNHDLNAFLDERLRFIPIELHQYFHKKLTSFDTEELPFQIRLIDSTKYILSQIDDLLTSLETLANKYRQQAMLGRTHGQEAKIQSLGKKILTYVVVIRFGKKKILQALEDLRFSKLSGAIGNFQGISPETEKLALSYFGFEPFYGATQIMPRELHTALVDALANFMATVNKIALDLRLGARSGLPIFQEPFGKKQKGSSAMPHKKNTIATEQLNGMYKMAMGYALMIRLCIETWEERDISQSCVERVAWPDLFHVVGHSLRTLNRVVSGLVIFDKNINQEIVNSCGLYASEEAKEFIKDIGAEYGLGYEDAYRIAQLAAFNAFEGKTRSLEVILLHGILEVSPNLDAKAEDVKKWNEILDKIFQDPQNKIELKKYFEVAYHLRGEEILFQQILG